MSEALSNTAVAELARLVVRAAFDEQSEPTTVDELSLTLGISRRVLQYRCQAVGVIARDCVHFVQCLRAVLSADDFEPAALIPFSDPRTLRRLWQRGGLTASRPSVQEFIARQSFLTHPMLRHAILTELATPR